MRKALVYICIMSIVSGCAPSSMTTGNVRDDQVTVLEYDTNERGAYIRGGSPASGGDPVNQVVFCAEPPADTASARALSFLGELNLPEPDIDVGNTTLADSGTQQAPVAETAGNEEASMESGGAGGALPETPTEPPPAPIPTTSSEATARLALGVANNVVVLARRTELVEVQRQALYRLCELAANNSLPRDAIEDLTKEILFTIRVLAVAELSGTQTKDISPVLLERALTRTDQDTILTGADSAIYVYDNATDTVRLVVPGRRPPVNINTSTVRCENVDRLSNERLTEVATSVGLDVAAAYDNAQLEQQLRNACEAIASINDR